MGRWARWGCAALLAACGSDGEPSDATGSSSGGTGSTTTVGSSATSATVSGSTSSGSSGAASTGGSSGGSSGGEASTGGSTGADLQPACDIGEPLTLRDDTWTAIFSPGTACGNAGEAGFIVNATDQSTNLLVYFGGGGACFNEGDCGASLLDGFSEAEGIMLAQNRRLFDRDNPDNPFAGWDYVFVPYCTGDFHSGDNVASYGTQHVGFANLEAHLTRIVPTFCDAERVVVTGTSAGGFGSTFAYTRIHELFGSTSVDLIADSGPYMTAAYMPEAAQEMIDGNWGFRPNYPADCAECADHWDAIYPYIAERWPDETLSILSYNRDPSIQSRFNPYTPLDDLDIYAEAMDALADDVVADLPNVHVFYLDGTGHVLLNGMNPFALTQGGTTLGEFITQQLDNDPGWTDVRP